MEALEAIEAVLHTEGKPLHYREITSRVLNQGLWHSEGKTPEASINSMLAVDIQERGAESRFRRTDRGVFDLNRSLREEAPVAARAPNAVSPERVAPSAPGKKLNGGEIRAVARQLILAHPEGIRYGQLLAAILDQYPATMRNTVQGTIWNLDAQFPKEVHKPARGLYKPGPGSAPLPEDEKSEERPADRPKEEMFYGAFADWLKNDAGDATEAIPFGGASLGKKWGTPDVIGVYKPRPSDRIKFPNEIVSAEIKVDPQAPVIAFGQAVAYRLFSSKTYVVMPNTISKEDLDRLEALCMLFGVGLVLFTLNTEIGRAHV